jgi:hypothetical protein
MDRSYPLVYDQRQSDLSTFADRNLA